MTKDLACHSERSEESRFSVSCHSERSEESLFQCIVILNVVKNPAPVFPVILNAVKNLIVHHSERDYPFGARRLRKNITSSSQILLRMTKDLACHSERSEESLFQCIVILNAVKNLALTLPNWE